MEGFAGVDYERGPAVDVIADLSKRPWPFATASVDQVRTWHFLEHLSGYDFAGAVDEIARILKPGGLLYVKVPHRERGPYNPFHHRVFDRHSFDYWLDCGKTESCLQARFGVFHRVRQEVVYLSSGFPHWHLQRYAPRVWRGLCEEDERGLFARFPAISGAYGELREWLVRTGEAR